MRIKKIILFIFAALFILATGYVWLLSEGAPDKADQSPVSTDIPVISGS